MKTYEVTVAIEGRRTFEVEATDSWDALVKAFQMARYCDFEIYSTPPIKVEVREV